MYGHILRRGIEAATEHFTKEEALEWQANEFARQYPQWEMPAWGAALIMITTILFGLLVISLDYTVRLMMTNLAIVEAPSTAVINVYTPLSSDDEKKEGADIEIEETHIVSDKPVTNSIRRTMQHITSRGGSAARWRGFATFIAYVLATGFSQGLIMAWMQPHGLSVPRFFLVDLLPALMLARLHCAWTHTTMTTGNKKYSERRVSKAEWKQLLPITTLKVAVTELSVFAMVLSLAAAGKAIERTACPGRRSAIAVMPAILGVVLYFFAIVPVHIALIRKEASLLPESEETIVPVDRTFGGSRICSVPIGVWWRVVKLHLKWFMLTLVVALSYIHITLFEVWAIMGDALPVLLMSAKARLQTINNL